MNSRQAIPDLVQWYEGMLIGPQHFQQAFWRNEHLLHYHLTNAIPYYWGIKKLHIDKPLLVSGRFQVRTVEAVMPDGTEIYFDDSTGETLEVNLEDYKEELQNNELNVYITVNSKGMDDSSFSGNMNRYRSISGSPILDVNTGDNAIEIPRLVASPALWVGELLPSRFAGFPIARIAYNGTSFVLGEFESPSPHIENLTIILEMVEELIRLLREKATFLAEKAGVSSPNVTAAMVMETKLMIQALVSQLPLLESLVRSPVTHPFQLYQALNMITGAIAGLDPGLIPPVFAPYDHNQLLESFRKPVQYIKRIAEQGVQEAYSCLPFQFDKKEQVYSLLLEGLPENSTIIVGIRSVKGADMAKVDEWFKQCLIGSESHLVSIRERRIRGAERILSEGSETLVPLRGVRLFKITLDSSFVAPDEKLIIIPPNTQVSGVIPVDQVVYYQPNSTL